MDDLTRGLIIAPAAAGCKCGCQPKNYLLRLGVCASSRRDIAVYQKERRVQIARTRSRALFVFRFRSSLLSNADVRRPGACRPEHRGRAIKPNDLSHQSRNRHRELARSARELEDTFRMVPCKVAVRRQVRSHRQQRVVEIRMLVEVGTHERYRSNECGLTIAAHPRRPQGNRGNGGNRGPAAVGCSLLDRSLMALPYIIKNLSRSRAVGADFGIRLTHAARTTSMNPATRTISA